MKRLSTLFEERGEAYANADVIVSLESRVLMLFRFYWIFHFSTILSYLKFAGFCQCFVL